MDCVEVVPLREILRRRREEVEKDKKGSQQQKGGPRYHVASEVTPETPFVPRMMRELLERDEIGEIQDASVTSHLTGTNCSRSPRNTSDAFTYT